MQQYESGRAGGQGAGDVLRVGVIGSPRSGNSWLRGLLASVYDLKEVAVLAPEDLDWANLPPRVVLQIHWHPVEPFISLLRAHGFHVVTPARHPLDLFISSLNYQQYVDTPLRWSDRDGTGELTLRGASPRSALFLNFACGWVGENLLSTSREWWSTPGTIPVRYEELVADTRGVLERVVQAINAEVRRPVECVADAYAIDRCRVEYGVWHYHYWQGKPGHWKLLLPAHEASQIAAARVSDFQALGYPCDPDPELSATQADLNWFRLQFDSMREHVEQERSKHSVTRKSLQAERDRAAMLQAVLDEARAHTATAQQALLSLRKRHAAARRVLAHTRAQLAEALGRFHEVEHAEPLPPAAQDGGGSPGIYAMVRSILGASRKSA